VTVACKKAKYMLENIGQPEWFAYVANVQLGKMMLKNKWAACQSSRARVRYCAGQNNLCPNNKDFMEGPTLCVEKPRCPGKFTNKTLHARMRHLNVSSKHW
jgi:hypothetical protein